MGDKIASKQLAQEAGVTTVPGHLEAIPDAEAAVAIARDIGYPVMIKASAGGGGKGMRIARDDAELRDGLRGAASEARAEFRRRARLHREIYRGAAAHRNPGARRQARQHRASRRARMLDPAPPSEGDRGGAVPVHRPGDPAAMGAQAVALARAVGYRTAGTVEFIVDRQRNFYFLEMNTRLQVEHPVTELVTGLDLVELMIRIAAGEKLPFTQDDVRLDRMGDRGTGLCRGSEAQFSAVDRAAGALSAARGRRDQASNRRLRGRRDHGLLRPDDRQAGRRRTDRAAAVDAAAGGARCILHRRRAAQHRVSGGGRGKRSVPCRRAIDRLHRGGISGRVRRAARARPKPIA